MAYFFLKQRTIIENASYFAYSLRTTAETIEFSTYGRFSSTLAIGYPHQSNSSFKEYKQKMINSETCMRIWVPKLTKHVILTNIGLNFILKFLKCPKLSENVTILSFIIKNVNVRLLKTSILERIKPIFFTTLHLNKRLL